MAVTMSRSEEISRIKQECEEICKMIHNKKKSIYQRIETMEREKAKRELKKKEVMLREMKRVLALLNDTEKDMISDLKSTAFDRTKEAGLIHEKCRKLIDDITLAQLKEKEGKAVYIDVMSLKWDEDLEAMKKEIAEVDLDLIESCSTMDIHHNTSHSEFESVRSQYRDLVYHSLGSINPKDFLAGLDKLSVVEKGKIQFSIFHVDRAILGQEFLLDMLKITVASPANFHSESRIIFEESSVLDKIKTKQAWLGPEAGSGVGQLVVTVKQQRVPIQVSVKLFDRNIVGSPRIGDVPSLSEEDPPADQTAMSLLNATPTVQYLVAGADAHDLDDSELKSHDMTGRRSTLLEMVQRYYKVIYLHYHILSL